MAENIKRHVTHIKSKVIEGGLPKLPTAAQLQEGEIAVNYGNGVETLSIKNESGNVVTFSSDNYYSEKKLGSGFTGANSAKTVTEGLDSKVNDSELDGKVATAITQNPSVSGAVGNIVDGKLTAYSSATEVNTALSNKSDVGHTHAISAVTGLQTALDGKQASGNYITYDAFSTYSATTIGSGFSESSITDVIISNERITAQALNTINDELEGLSGTNPIPIVGLAPEPPSGETYPLTITFAVSTSKFYQYLRDDNQGIYTWQEITAPEKAFAYYDNGQGTYGFYEIDNGVLSQTLIERLEAGWYLDFCGWNAENVGGYAGVIMYFDEFDNLYRTVSLDETYRWDNKLSGITSSDVTNALGYTPLSEVTYNNVITALGYTPPTADTNNRRVFYATCGTGAGTYAKTASIGSAEGWELTSGTTVGVKFTNTNTYSSSNNITLNVNGSGAKSIKYKGTVEPTKPNPNVYGTANRIIYYMYDGTYWVWMGMDGYGDAAFLDTGTTAGTVAAGDHTHGNYASTATTVSAGTGLTGGGNLSDNRTISLAMPTTHSATTYTSASITSSEPIVYALVRASSNLSNQVCPVSLVDGQQCNVIYMGSTTAATYTVTITTNYTTPTGAAIPALTVPANGYVEINYINIKGIIFVRGV